MAITMYTTQTCPYCFAAKDLLASKGLVFIEYDVSFNVKLKTKLIEKTGRRTVPQIFIDEEHIGGFIDLQRYFNERH